MKSIIPLLLICTAPMMFVVTAAACTFKEVCRFNDPKMTFCIPRWHFEEPISDDCNNITLPAIRKGTCQNAECEETCDAFWPWDDPPMCNLDDEPWKKVKWIRRGPKPPVPLLNERTYKYCPLSKEVNCNDPRLPTPSTTTKRRRRTTTFTPPSKSSESEDTKSETTGPVSSSTIDFPWTTTVETVSTSASTDDQPATSFESGSTAHSLSPSTAQSKSDFTTIVSTFSATPPSPAPVKIESVSGDKKTEPAKWALPGWAIALMVIIAIVILILLAVAVVVGIIGTRKRKRTSTKPSKSPKRTPKKVADETNLKKLRAETTPKAAIKKDAKKSPTVAAKAPEPSLKKMDVKLPSKKAPPAAAPKPKSISSDDLDSSGMKRSKSVAIGYDPRGTGAKVDANISASLRDDSLAARKTSAPKKPMAVKGDGKNL